MCGIEAREAGRWHNSVLFFVCGWVTGPEVIYELCSFQSYDFATFNFDLRNAITFRSKERYTTVLRYYSRAQHGRGAVYTLVARHMLRVSLGQTFGIRRRSTFGSQKTNSIFLLDFYVEN